MFATILKSFWVLGEEAVLMFVLVLEVGHKMFLKGFGVFF
jgi:hypothetical protein